MAVRECYIAMIEMEDQQQTMCIGEQRAPAEPVEEMEEVNLDDAWRERTTRIGTLASWLVRISDTSLLYKPSTPRSRREVPLDGEIGFCVVNRSTKTQTVLLSTYHRCLDRQALEKSYEQSRGSRKSGFMGSGA